MSILHPPDPDGPIVFRCAQAGCPLCLEYLLTRHTGLVRAAVWAQHCRDVPRADLLQVGRIGLWHAILHFDPDRGVAFSTYAWTAIGRHIRRLAGRWKRPHGWLPTPPVPDPAVQAEADWHQAAVHAAVCQALRSLTPELRQVIVATYGLDGQPPRSLADLGRQYGVTRACVWQWRQKALVRLRVPAISGRLRRLGDQDQRPAYRRDQARNMAWRRRQRHRGRP
jgi:RNA polymerase sigma factor (sigma-70 family)